jgi:hypothetical protein
MAFPVIREWGFAMQSVWGEQEFAWEFVGDRRHTLQAKRSQVWGYCDRILTS